MPTIHPFLLAEHPCDENAGVFILSTIAKNAMLIQVVCLNDKPSAGRKKFIIQKYVNPEGDTESYELSVHSDYRTIDIPNTHSILQQAWLFWLHYLRWEDSHIPFGSLDAENQN